MVLDLKSFSAAFDRAENTFNILGRDFCTWTNTKVNNLTVQRSNKNKRNGTSLKQSTTFLVLLEFVFKCCIVLIPNIENL